MNRIVPAMLFFLATVSAAAASPYGGIDLNATSIDLNQGASESYPQSTAGFDIHGGYRFGSFAAEIGYGISDKNGNAAVDNLRLDKLTVDALAYVPTGPGFNIVLTGGGSQTNYGISSYGLDRYQVNSISKVTRADVPVLHGDEFDWRAGGGLSFDIGDHFELHMIGRYEPLSMHRLSNYALSLDAGFNLYL